MTLQKIREGEKLLKIILLLIASCLHLMVYASEPVEISGTIVIPQGVRIPDGGLDVVLLKFVVNDQGEITTTGPQARVKSQQDGSFLISQIPRELKAAFKIGTRVEGSLHQSNVLFMNKSDSKYQVDLVVPGVSENVEVLGIEKASLIFERDHGKIRVTEVWEIKNPTRDRVDSIEKGFPINLPDSISDFIMPDVFNLILALSLGVMGSCGHYFMSQAARHADVAVTSPFEYTSFIFVGLMGYLFFNEIPNKSVIIGAIFIMISGVYVAYRERKKNN